MGSEKSGEIDHKSEDISGSVNRFDAGAIFLPRLDQELSRNAFVVSILFPERISLWSIDFFMTPKNDRKSPIFEVPQKWPGSFKEASRMHRECPRVSRSVQERFVTSKNGRKKKSEKIDVFPHV